MSSSATFNVSILYVDYPEQLARNSWALVYCKAKLLFGNVSRHKAFFYVYLGLDDPVGFFFYLFYLFFAKTLEMSNIEPGFVYILECTRLVNMLAEYIPGCCIKYVGRGMVVC